MLKNSENSADQLANQAKKQIRDHVKTNEELIKENDDLRLENAALVHTDRAPKKRYEPVDKKSLEKMELAVRRFQIAKRRKKVPDDTRLSTNDLRAFQKNQITTILKDFKAILCPFKSIMKIALFGRQPQKLLPMFKPRLFSDGFAFSKKGFNSPSQLKRFLSDFNIHVKMPTYHKTQDFMWVMPTESNLDLSYMLGQLRKALMA